MGLYLGTGEKVKVNLNGETLRMELYTEYPITNNTKMVSSDGYILKDSNGVYLTMKEDDE